MMIEKSQLINKTLNLLEFNRILNNVASCAMSEEASAIIRKEKPSGDPALVTQTKEAVRAVISRINEDDPSRRFLPSISFLFPRLEAEGTSLEIDEACAIGLFVERGGELKKWLLPITACNDRINAGMLVQILNDIPDCSEPAAAVFRVMDREGNLRDLSELREIKQRIRSLKTALDGALSRYAASEETRNMLQSTLPSQRDGRTVLAVKANFRGRIRGIVHEVSSSGQTIFVEPEDVVEKNNAILIENRNLDAQIRKIMLDLTKHLAVNRDTLKVFHAMILSVEVLMAKARYSLGTSGYFTMPHYEDGESHILALVQARHPLIENAVPIDLTMGAALKIGDQKSDTTRALIITGPNTGGKTVTLKTVGLLSMMNQIGLALPAAAGTALPVFDGIFADIGDEQSIGQSLSTFSAHITNIAAIITHATSRSLVLLDELGSGTDPQEGSAIAMAILDRLIQNKTRFLITTHHGILKNYGYSRQEVENASVEFNAQTLSPTYRIITGIPGESRALEIAGQKGLPADIIRAAKKYLDSGHSDISALISGLKEKHRQLDNLGEKAKLEEHRLKDQRRKSDLKELMLRQKELELKAGHAGKLRRLLDESRKTLENLVREIKESSPAAEDGLTREKTLKVKEFLHELACTVETEDAALHAEERAIAEERRSTTGTGAGTTPFTPGMEVYVGENKRRGILVRPDRKGKAGTIWVVEIGSLKVNYHESELSPAPPSRHKPLAASVDLAAASTARSEINLCGMRMEEALDALRRQTDAAALSGLRLFSVIHGKGDGILQKGVHEWLKQEAAVADFYFSHPELGGFGRTEVVLK